jgi:hypothetical protein
VALRKPLRNVSASRIQALLAPQIERLLVAGIGATATLMGAISTDNPDCALVANLETLLLPTEAPVTFKL